MDVVLSDKYYTGKPCKHGHVSERYVSSSDCVQCAKDRATKSAKENPVKTAERVKAWNISNVERQRINKKEWKANNKDIVLASNKKHRDAHKEQIRKTRGIWYINNKQKHADYNKEWRTANLGKCAAYVRARQAARIERTPAWLTEDDEWLMEEAYILAALRTKMLGFPWHVDHVIPLRGKRVSGLHVPTNLQVIPGSENLSKSNNY